MTKRLLDANASDFAAMTGRQLLEAIRLSEGRVIAAEVVAVAPPLVDKVSNGELAAGMGADLILLNLYDATNPQITGLPTEGENGTEHFGHFSLGMGRTIADLKRMIGRPVGLNLEPIEAPEAITTSGRLAAPENAQLAVEQGADFIVITGNPKTGVTTQGIACSVRAIREAVGDRVMLLAGKGHSAGSAEKVVSEESVEAFSDAGADGVALPAPGTVPGMTLEAGRRLVELAHRFGLVALNAMGTSQEGTSIGVIEQLALMSKMTGADVHQLGDAGYMGIAVPENITAFSIAIRGRRHTWHRMATSALR